MREWMVRTNLKLNKTQESFRMHLQYIDGYTVQSFWLTFTQFSITHSVNIEQLKCVWMERIFTFKHVIIDHILDPYVMKHLSDIESQLFVHLSLSTKMAFQQECVTYVLCGSADKSK